MTGNQTTRQRERRLIEALRRAGYTVGRGNISGQEHARVIAPLGNFQMQPTTISNQQPITA